MSLRNDAKAVVESASGSRCFKRRAEAIEYVERACWTARQARECPTQVVCKRGKRTSCRRACRSKDGLCITSMRLYYAGVRGYFGREEWNRGKPHLGRRSAGAEEGGMFHTTQGRKVQE